jgi:hypothetical protein
MVEITAALLVIAFLGAVFYALKEWGKSEAYADEAEEELKHVAEIMKDVKDNAKRETEINRDYATGEPRRMQGKYDLD